MKPELKQDDRDGEKGSEWRAFKEIKSIRLSVFRK